MKISYNWLKEYVDINLTPEKLAEELTMHSFEVENIIYQDKGLENVVVGEVIEKRKHPDADKLSIVKVKINAGDFGSLASKLEAKLPKSAILEIVCGAPNIDVEQKVLVALIGAQLPCGLKIEKRKVRGIYSNGMVCAEDELGLSDNHKEIMVLDKNLKVGTLAKEALGLDDVIFEIDILPNRAHDCLSHIGVAREIAAILNLESPTSLEDGFRIWNLEFGDHLEKSSALNIKVENDKLCRRYSAVVIKDVKVKESPNWLKRRLESCGVRPINNIVDTTNYIMLALGQPMHAFDYDKLNPKSKYQIKSQAPNPKPQTVKIIVRRAKKDESILALDDKIYELTEDDLIIADEEKPIAIAGVMGGAETAVDENTKNIIFESANFDSISVRKTSRRLKLASESSYRFEREIDPEFTIKAIEMAAKLTEDLAGRKIYNGVFDVYSDPAKTEKITFEFARIKNLLGIEIEKSEAKRILESLGFGVLEKGDNLEVKVPTFRIDVERVNDVIEEIARIYGYGKIPEIPARVEMKSVAQDKNLELEKKAKIILEGLGFSEVYNYSFLSEKDILNAGLKAENHLELENPLSEEFRFLRTSLFSGLLKNANLNLKHEDNFRLFEIGRVYFKNNSGLPDEKKIIAGIAASKDKSTDEGLFYKFKGGIEAFLEKLGCNKLSYKEIKNPGELWHKGRSAEIICQREAIGKAGEIHPAVLSAFDLKIKVLYFEIHFEKLIKTCAKEVKYKRINKFPKIELDLSVIFDEGVKWEDIRNIVLKAGKNLVRNIEPFDVYRGRGLDKNKKSVAFRITYQAGDRTLTDGEVAAVQEKIIGELKKTGGEIRS